MQQLIKSVISLGREVRNIIAKQSALTLKQIGLNLDRRGSIATMDAAFCQPNNRHRNILSMPIGDPVLAQSVYVAPNATIAGNVYVGAESYFGFGAVAQATAKPIRIGMNTKIGDNTTLEADNWLPEQVFPASINIGNDVNIEHGCLIRSCVIDDDVHVGFKTVIMEGSQLERGCVIAPNSYIPIGSRIPANTLWSGSPVQFVRELTANEVKSINGQNKILIGDVDN